MGLEGGEQSAAMDVLAQFFATNRVIVYSIYGQVFFVMGLAVLLQSRKHSRLALARSLWLLGTFGLLHGASEWAFVFIPIQAEYLPAALVNLLWLAHVVLEAVSFACLFQFGVELVSPTWGGRLLRALPAALFVLWAVIFFFIETYMAVGDGRAQPSVFVSGDVWARYLLALPGALCAGVGLLLEVRTVAAMELPQIARYLRGAAVSLLVYAVVAGLLVPGANYPLASVVNYDLLVRWTGVPVPVFRSLCGLAIAYFIVRALSLFEVEMDRLLEGMERRQMIALERERIGRELHDGTIQSIYAAGLALEDACYAIGDEPDQAQTKVRQVMQSLNQTIADIRNYILDLHSEIDNRQFEEQLLALAREFGERAGVKVNVTIRPHWRRPFTPEQSAHLLQVAREAFANVARHAAAARVEVVLSYGRDSARLEIRDDGRGFAPQSAANRVARGEGLGLRNLSRRLEMLGGTLRLRTAPGKGTSVTAELPLARMSE